MELQERNSLKNLFLTLFILGICSCVFQWIPFIGGYFTIPINLAIIIIAIITLTKSPKDLPKPKGSVIFIIVLIVAFFWALIAGALTVGSLAADDGSGATLGGVLAFVGIINIVFFAGKIVATVFSYKSYKQYSSSDDIIV